MRRLALALGFLIALAPCANASTITVDNLWSLPANSFSLWAGDWRLVSQNLVTTPNLPDNYSLAPIDEEHPLLGGTSVSWTLPQALDAGFTYGGLTIGGTCPNDCGYAVWPENTIYVGDFVGLGTTVFDFLWPAVDGGTVPIFRVTYTSGGPQLGTARDQQIATPEPSSLGLIAVGAAVLAMHRHRIRPTPRRN